MPVRWRRRSARFRGKSSAAWDRGSSGSMSKAPKTVFVCQECGAQAPKWVGKCEDCGKWNTYVEERPQDPAAAAASAGHRYSLASAQSAQLYADIKLENHSR